MHQCASAATFTCHLQREHSASISFECNEELHRQEVQNADDIRLSIVLLRTCMADKQQFCPHVPYGARLFYWGCVADLLLSMHEVTAIFPPVGMSIAAERH